MNCGSMSKSGVASSGGSATWSVAGWWVVSAREVVLFGQHHAPRALGVEQPVDGVDRRADFFTAAGHGVQPQQLEEVEALFAVGLGLDHEEFVAGLWAGLAQHEGVPGQLPCANAVLDENPLAHRQLPEPFAVGVDGKQAVGKAAVGRCRLAVFQCERQAVLVDPLEVADIGVAEAGHHLHFHRVQPQHQQTHPGVLGAAAQGHLGAGRRQHGLDHFGFAEEEFQLEGGRHGCYRCGTALRGARLHGSGEQRSGGCAGLAPVEHHGEAPFKKNKAPRLVPQGFQCPRCGRRNGRVSPVRTCSLRLPARCDRIWKPPAAGPCCRHRCGWPRR